jgi:hypothetical protein
MTTITLPPLPPYAGFYPQTNVPVWTERMLRARDLEVARLVLEGAAELCQNERLMFGDEEWNIRCELAQAMRALEVKHHE